MGRGKDLGQLESLDENVLAEVVREGELMMAAQLATATAADQRALTWAGFTITLAAASLGASATLASAGRHVPLAVLTGLLGVLLAISSYQAVLAVRPSKFALPGNRPENWLPNEWQSDKERNLKQARIEQARCLDDQIDDNCAAAEESAMKVQLSIDLTATSVLVAGIFTAAWISWTLLA